MKPALISRRRYQKGAETVEFAITLLFFLLVFLMVIEFAIVVYDRGTVNNAARWGARQASLFWVDPADLQSLEDGTIYVVPPSIKRAFVDSVMAWTENNVLIDPSTLGLSVSMQAAMDGGSSAPNLTSAVIDMTDVAAITVDIDYAHQYLALTGFVGLGLNNRSSAGME